MSQPADARHVSARDLYAAWAPSYETRDNPMLAMADVVLRSWWPTQRGQRVLEIGCGNGRNLKRASDAGCSKVIGVDLSPEMLALARAQCPDATLVLGDARGSIPVADKSADTVLVCLVLEHLPSLSPLLTEIRRLCSLGGDALILDVHPERLVDGSQAKARGPAGETYVSDAHVHTPVQVEKQAGAAGLCVVERQMWIPAAGDARKAPALLKHVGHPLLMSYTLRHATAPRDEIR